MEDSRFISVYKDWYSVGYNYNCGGYMSTAMHHEKVYALEVPCSKIPDFMNEALENFKIDNYIIRETTKDENDKWFTKIVLRRDLVEEKSTLTIIVYANKDEYSKVEPNDNFS